jgi:hypothetical protein
MSPVWWMVGGSLGAWLLATVVAPVRINPEALGGMIGPLASAVITWAAAERTYRSTPGQLTRVMVRGFGLKVLFFGLYVVVLLRGLGMRPMMFAVSFTAFFIALHVIEAVFLKRLLIDGAPSPQSQPLA